MVGRRRRGPLAPGGHQALTAFDDHVERGCVGHADPIRREERRAGHDREAVLVEQLAAEASARIRLAGLRGNLDVE